MARLEVRRRCAWYVLHAFEYCKDSDDSSEIEQMFAQVENNSKLFSDGNNALPPTDAEIRNLDFSLPGSQKDFQRFLLKLQCEKCKLSSIFMKELLKKAAVIVKQQPNINEIELNASQSVSVCGDLHGNLLALLHFFEQNGMPSETNLVIFNGDFVDRGYKSVEVLSVILAALLAFPNSVFLNRGNHEDINMNKQYGFSKELDYKFPNEDKQLLELCSEVFRNLPVACIINDAILVCHGGVSSTTSIEHIKRVDRSKFVSVLSPKFDGADAVSVSDWEQLLNLIWSDPQQKLGCRPNVFRGGGCYFGPNVTEAFLQKTNLKMIIRSHECFPEGWQLTHSGSVLTVFTALDYFGNHTNDGAFVQISAVSESSAAGREPGDGENREQEDDSSDDEENKAVSLQRIFAANVSLIPEVKIIQRIQSSASQNESRDPLRTVNAAFLKLWRHVLRCKKCIMETFNKYDHFSTGELTVNEWCMALSEATGLQLPWRFLRHFLVRMGSSPTNVVYESMFEGEAIVHQALKNDPALARDIFNNQGSLQAMVKVIDAKGRGKVNLLLIHKSLKSSEMNSKVQRLIKIFDRLIPLLDKQTACSFDLGEFLSSFRFVEIRKRERRRTSDI
ncbi:unnamed protein product [Calicophoron daubneyi]|uniref:Serine/threonine-protein phosphatase n=1 Tax=Calicophoron daubneyi TaxID=300641 RepID=A0AAV2TZB0_CALDB